MASVKQAQPSTLPFFPRGGEWGEKRRRIYFVYCMIHIRTITLETGEENDELQQIVQRVRAETGLKENRRLIQCKPEITKTNSTTTVQ